MSGLLVWHRDRRLLLWSAAWVLLSIGCGRSDGLDRIPVFGTVEWSGGSIAEGTISLYPTGKGPSASTNIENGRYRFTRHTGPTAGSYRAEIIISTQEKSPAGKPVYRDWTFEMSVPQENSFEKDFTLE